MKNFITIKYVAMTQKRGRMVATLVGLMLLCASAVAQKHSTEERLIVLRGQVNCLKPERGVLADVAIFNVNKKWGTLSDAKGNFSIRMGPSDTIIFSAPLHQDYKYYLNDRETIADHTVEITMQPDAVWLETVIILGRPGIDEFKNEILNLEFDEDRLDVMTPIIDKYAKQRETGEGSFVLNGTLSYLGSKFSKYARMKRQIKRSNHEE
jgi:hypothetical protein